MPELKALPAKPTRNASSRIDPEAVRERDEVRRDRGGEQQEGHHLPAADPVGDHAGGEPPQRAVEHGDRDDPGELDLGEVELLADRLAEDAEHQPDREHHREAGGGEGRGRGCGRCPRPRCSLSSCRPPKRGPVPSTIRYKLRFVVVQSQLRGDDDDHTGARDARIPGTSAHRRPARESRGRPGPPHRAPRDDGRPGRRRDRAARHHGALPPGQPGPARPARGGVPARPAWAGRARSTAPGTAPSPEGKRSEDALQALTALLAETWRTDDGTDPLTAEQAGERWALEHAPQLSAAERRTASSAGAWLGRSAAPSTCCSSGATPRRCAPATTAAPPS